MPEEDLISKETYKSLCWAVRDYTSELYKLTGEHSLISKYRERLWFQRVMRMTEGELTIRYMYLAKMILDIESEIDQCRRRIFLHDAAVEQLQGSMNPFAGINFKETPLVQRNLF